MAEYKLSYTASEIDERLGKVTDLEQQVKNIPTKVSDLNNDKGYITGYTETDPTVPAWAKASSKPSYTKSEVGLGNVDNVKQYSASNPPPYPVTKVNNKTGAVTLSASDVGADASGTASSAVSSHNTNTSAHADIREQINQLSSEIVDEIIVMSQDEYNVLTKSNLQALYAQGVRLIAVETSDSGSEGTTYTNQVPISIDVDGNVYNTIGYKNNFRINSSGQEVELNEQLITGFIPCKAGDVIRFRYSNNVPVWTDNTSGTKTSFNFYNSPTTHLGQFVSNSSYYGIFSASSGEVNKVTKVGDVWEYTVTNNSAIAWVRLTVPRSFNGIYGNNLIVTINQEITEV